MKLALTSAPPSEQQKKAQRIGRAHDPNVISRECQMTDSTASTTRCAVMPR